KPDMLVQVTFLSLARPTDSAAGAGELRLLVPRQLVDTAGEGHRVWLADRVANVARSRAVKLRPAGGGAWGEGIGGLNAADKLIPGDREGLHDGQRIRITGEDTALGVSPRSAGQAPSRLPRTFGGNSEYKGDH